MDEDLKLIEDTKKERAWLNQHYDSIQEENGGRFIAISNQRIVAASKKIDAVLKKLKQENIKPAITLVEFVPKKGIAIIL